MTKNMLTDAQNKFWYSKGNTFNGCDVKQQQELSNLAFYAGARWSTNITSELSPHIAKFIEMMILLGYLERDQD